MVRVEKASATSACDDDAGNRNHQAETHQFKDPLACIVWLPHGLIATFWGIVILIYFYIVHSSVDPVLAGKDRFYAILTSMVENGGVGLVFCLALIMIGIGTTSFVVFQICRSLIQTQFRRRESKT